MNCYVSNKPVQELRAKFFSNKSDDASLQILITADELNFLTRKIAYDLNQKYKNETRQVHLIGLLTGAYYFLADLTKYLTFRYAVHFLKVTSYDGEKKIETIYQKNALMPYEKEDLVVFVDELIDSGETMNKLLQQIPHALSCACLTKNKPADFFGCDFVPKAWLIGFGLDDNGDKRGWIHLFCKNYDADKINEFRTQLKKLFETDKVEEK
ncbi:Guanine_phosphoribosyltransferase [Hexamita inflata]|uniref:Guanine phosphoribosyltransferase n=1 Tax=Hexamita inflata TaxID=28002 RepID=A0AA86R1B8_9EUKA|nr:Guanine phosphoribosyltransferase [Hexamita inflata]